MIVNKKLEFDFPICWTKSMKLMVEMKNFTHFEGTVPLSRMKKKEKYLVDLLENSKKLFSLILKNPLSYEICVYFCKTRIELNSLVVIKMCANYSNRFSYYHRVFLKLEKDLLCLEKIDFIKFDFHKENYKSLVDDFRSFTARKFELINILSLDYKNFNIKNGSFIFNKQVITQIKVLNNPNLLKEIHYIRNIIEKIIAKISKECVKLNAKDTQFFNETPNLSVSDPELPPENSSINIPSHGDKSSNAVSLPESKPLDTPAEGKKKPSAPSHNVESEKSRDRNTENINEKDKLVPNTQSNKPASLSSVSLQHFPTSQDSMIEKKGSPSLSFLFPQHKPIKQLNTELRSSFLALLQQTKNNLWRINLGNTILPLVTISFFSLRFFSKGFNPLSNDRLQPLEQLMIVNPLVFISIGLSLIIMYLFYNYRKDSHFKTIIQLFMQVFFLYLVIYTFFEYTNLFQPIIDAINPLDKETSYTSTEIVTTSPTEDIKQSEENKDIKQSEEKKDIKQPEEKEQPWYKRKLVWVVIFGVTALVFYYFSRSSSSPSTFRSSTDSGSSAELSDIINRRIVNTYAENRALEREVYAAAYLIICEVNLQHKQC